MGDSGRDIQSEIEGIKPDEIEQMKIEAAIENIQKSILSRSHLYINVIFVVFGAYALVLSAIYFTNSSNLSSLVSSPYYKFGIFCLCLSLAALLMAFVALTRGFFEMDKFSLSKLKIQPGLQGKLTPKEIAQVNVSYSIKIKNGTELVNYNKKMYAITSDLILYNKQSEGFILLSLLCFGAFFSLLENSELPFYLLMGILLFLLVLFTWNHESRKKTKKQS